MQDLKLIHQGQFECFQCFRQDAQYLFISIFLLPVSEVELLDRDSGAQSGNETSKKSS